MCIKVMVALILATHPSPKGNSYRIKTIAKNICYYSAKRDLDPYLVLSVIRHESHFRTRVVSRTDDYGLMQINIRAHKRIRCNLLKIKCNIKEGTKILARIKRSCVFNHNHKKPTHWLRHYNWHSKKHHLRILWLVNAYKNRSKRLFKMIRRRNYVKLNISYACMGTLCGAGKM